MVIFISGSINSGKTTTAGALAEKLGAQFIDGDDLKAHTPNFDLSKDIPKVLQINLPDYQITTEPNHKAVGKIVDDELRKYFLGQTIVVRGISSSEHLDKTIDDLVEIIKRDGTDRYDPNRKGDRYENINGKHIDFFAFRRKVTSRMQLFKDISWGFYHGAKAIHGKPVRIDILIIYNADKLKRVTHQYEGRTDVKRDGFVFKDPAGKQDVLLGIITIA